MAKRRRRSSKSVKCKVSKTKLRAIQRACGKTIKGKKGGAKRRGKIFGACVHRKVSALKRRGSK